MLLLVLALLAAPPAAAPSPQAQAALDPAYSAFVEALESGINAREPAALDAHMDVETLLARATQGVSASRKFADGFARGIRKAGGGKMGKGIVSGMDDDSSFHLLRLRKEDGAVRALFRLIAGEGALNYFDFELAKNAAGKVVVADVYTYISGERLSDTLRRSYVTAAAEAEQGLLDRLMGKERTFLQAAPKVRQMQQLVLQGKNQEVLALAAQLPEAVRRDKLVLLLRMRAALPLEDDTAYRKAIEDFEATFPNDPALDLVSIDGHFLRKDYDAALKTIERLDRRVNDPYLQFFRGSVLLEKGDRAGAKARFQAAIEAESALAIAYFTLLALSLEDRDYKETARVLTALERDAGMELNDLTGDELYAGFVKSPEYARWMKQRGQR